MKQSSIAAGPPVVVLGAGPVGLAAAAHLAHRKMSFVVLEKQTVGGNVRKWGHVRMFSPWRYNIDSQVRRTLLKSGWQAPRDSQHPTGAELVAQLMEPLAAHPEIAPHLRLGVEAVSLSRRVADRLRSVDREQTPLLVRTRGPEGEGNIFAGAVIDATGTFGNPSPLGASGLAALGERDLASRIHYGVPNLRSRSVRRRYAGKRVAVVGSGDSAFNTLLEFLRCDATDPQAEVIWILRGTRPEFGGGESDQLPRRADLGQSVGSLLRRNALALLTEFAIESIRETQGALVLSSAGGEEVTVDEVVCVTGYRPDTYLLRELRVDLDVVTEAPARLGPLVDPNVHSCGTVPPHGYRELRHPEAGVFVVGMKSYGRAPTFLLATGYEQVRSVVAALAGDWEQASAVRLRLPETGVCSSPVAIEAGGV